MLPRKIIVLILLAFTGFMSGQKSVSAQSVKPNALYEVPSQLLLKGEENAAAEMKSGKLLRETFFPIGWSKNGIFAYYTEPADEACGCYFANLIIQDMRTDKVLWSHTNVNSNFDENAPPETIATYWRKHRKEFSRKLAEYGIVAGKNVARLDEINYRQDLLTPKLAVRLKPDEAEMTVGGDIILTVISKQRGEKIVYNKKYDPKKTETIRDAEISGALVSPFEPRAAIIIIETHRGWEGLPYITQINIIGTTLNAGFH